jgi:polyadenylate-binding protein
MALSNTNQVNQASYFKVYVHTLWLTGYCRTNILSTSVRLLEEIPINGKSVKVMWSLRRTQILNESETVVYLANLDKSIGEKTLRDTFSAFGSVISCTLLPDFGSGGTASITFDTQEAAKKAIKFINECLWNGEQM